MSTLTKEQAAVIRSAAAVPSLQAEYPVTARVIAAIPPGQGDYRPDTIVKSAIDLAWHIVTAENRFLEAVLSSRFDLAPLPRPESIRTGADVNEWYAGRFKSHLEGVQAMSDDRLVAMVDFRGMFERPAIMFVSLALNHTIHHRGQLSMYLRPMGAKVPAIYGESYDGRLAREAAERQA